MKTTYSVGLIHILELAESYTEESRAVVNSSHKEKQISKPKCIVLSYSRKHETTDKQTDLTNVLILTLKDSITRLSNRALPTNYTLLTIPAKKTKTKKSLDSIATCY